LAYVVVTTSQENVIPASVDEYKNEKGQTLLHYAAQNAHTGKTLHSRSLLVIFHAEMVAYLLGLGCSVNAKALNGNTPLHVAAGYKALRQLDNRVCMTTYQ
jgi:ankyrin repeat protein